MKDVENIHRVTFKMTLMFLVAGCALGLLGVWIPEFFFSTTGIKLMITNWVMFAGSLGAAVITKMLGDGD